MTLQEQLAQAKNNYLEAIDDWQVVYVTWEKANTELSRAKLALDKADYNCDMTLSIKSQIQWIIDQSQMKE